MRVYLLRHGETALNGEGRYQGRLDTPLSEAGVRALRPPAFSPEHVWVSPMLRASVWFPTAEQRVVENFREMDFGLFEGKTYRELAGDGAYRRWVDGGCTGYIPEGEDKASFCGRTCAAFARLLDAALATEEKTLVIVAHGGTQMAVRERWGVPRRDYFDWRAPVGGGFLLDASLWRKTGVLALMETVAYAKEDGT